MAAIVAAIAPTPSALIHCLSAIAPIHTARYPDGPALTHNHAALDAARSAFIPACSAPTPDNTALDAARPATIPDHMCTALQTSGTLNTQTPFYKASHTCLLIAASTLCSPKRRSLSITPSIIQQSSATSATWLYACAHSAGQKTLHHRCRCAASANR